MHVIYKRWVTGLACSRFRLMHHTSRRCWFLTSLVFFGLCMVNSSCQDVFEIRIDKEGNKSTMKNRNGMEKWSVLVVSPLTNVKVQTFREGFFLVLFFKADATQLKCIYRTDVKTTTVNQSAVQSKTAKALNTYYTV